MGRLIMWNLQTLDGYFEGERPWDLDFHTTVWGPELERFSLDQLEEVGALLFGRATYTGMADYWSSATGAIAELMNRIPKIVFSRTLEAATWANSRLVRGDAEAEVAALKREDGKDLFVFGSARLSDTLIRGGLFDEYRICVAPVVLRGGSPLFKPGGARVDLSLLEAKPLTTGGLILRYGPKPTEG
jgi:dihydrofolate reductase